MEDNLIFTKHELSPVLDPDARPFAERRAAFSAANTTNAQHELASTAPQTTLFEIAINTPGRPEIAWTTIVRVADVVALILASRASLGLTRWGHEARLAIVLDAAAGADSACQAAIVDALDIGFGTRCAQIARSGPQSDAAPDVFVATANSEPLVHTALHRLRMGLAARYQPEALVLDDAIHVAERSTGVYSSNRHGAADHRRLVTAMKALRRARRKHGEVGRLTPDLLGRFRALSRNLVDDDSARLTYQLMAELQNEE